jgi:glycosyltransferase involved in cell wall biosynthesis
MADSPKISVIMPVYNGERYLRESIESILGQTFTDFEFIIINDASTDSSAKIMQSYDDSRIRITNNSTNIGLTRSLNMALELAEGEYIARQDDDDISLPERFEKQIKYFEEQPETAVLGTSIYTIDEDGEIIGKRVISAEPSRNSFHDSFLIHGSTMYKKDIIRKLGGYNEIFRLSQDFDLWLRVAKHHQIRGIPETLYKLRYHQRSLQIKYRDEAALYHLLALRIDRDELDERALKDIKDNGIMSFYSYLDVNERVFYHNAMAYVHVRNNNMKLARAEYRKALELKPLDFRNRLNLFLSYLGKGAWNAAHRINEALKYR